MSSNLPQSGVGLRAALALAEKGFRVIPIFLDGAKKRPAIKGWQDLATNDPAKVRAMFEPFPTAMAGIVTGRCDGLL
jgi:hypothetical protein